MLAAMCASPAKAQHRYANSAWLSWGVFEVKMSGAEGPVAVRWTQFTNREYLIELDRGDQGPKKALKLKPSDVVLHHGLAEGEGFETSTSNPFQFVDLAFAFPTQALHEAYPTGVAAVPEARTESRVVLEQGTLKARLITTRVGERTVRFELALEGKGDWAVSGVWDGAPQRPLDDDVSVAPWRHESKVPISTLGEARALPSTHGR